MKGPHLITEYGKRLLGAILKECRDSQGWSLDDLVARIKEVTGHKLSKTTLNNLERGYTTPTWDTLALLSEVGYVFADPASRKKPLTAHDMFDIASEQSTLPKQASRIKKIRQGLDFPKTTEDAENYANDTFALSPMPT